MIPLIQTLYHEITSLTSKSMHIFTSRRWKFMEFINDLYCCYCSLCFPFILMVEIFYHEMYSPYNKAASQHMDDLLLLLFLIVTEK